MKTFHLDYLNLKTVVITLLNYVLCTVKTEGPLKCHTCDPETCKNFDKKAKPQVCFEIIIIK